MPRYIEYDRETGRILSIFSAPASAADGNPQAGVQGAAPPGPGSRGLAPLEEGFHFDMTACVVKDGKIVTLAEARRPKHEETQARREGAARLAALAKRYALASLLGDEAEMTRLRIEAEPYRVFYC